MTQEWKSIGECKAFETLKQLAKNPVDLTAPDVLTSERVEDFCCKGDIYKLLYSCQQVTEETLDGLQSLADECALVEQFTEMRQGAVMNKIQGFSSENRQVLHTACRDIFTNMPACEFATNQARAELEKLNDFLNELDQGYLLNGAGESFQTLIHVGIGGSDLGPRSMYEALQAYADPARQVYFISNVDPDDSARVLSQVDLSRSLVLVVSKSGTTLETLANETIVRTALTDAGLDPGKHCLSVTGESSPMDNPDRYLRSFYMYDYIGGRYSSTSMVGAVMLGFALGYRQLLEFLEGASTMDEAATVTDIRQNIPLLYALLGVWNHNFLGKPSVAVLPYSQALHRFPAHLQQCDMESNGKSVQRNGSSVQLKSGPVIWGEPGTNGQHAFYQLLHQGTEDVSIEFIGFRRSQRGKDQEIQGTNSHQKLMANMLAQSMALAIGKDDDNPNKRFSGNRANGILVADRLTPKSMGALLALYEAKIVFQGFCYNINSFDQEGVQLGKILATEILSIMSEKRAEPSLAKAFLAVSEMNE